jgi:RNA polymerase sigma-70 factor (ECF subfamily)
LSDEALLAGMAAGDDRAGATFIRRHQGRVYGVALAITADAAAAEDVAQETLIRAWRHADVFDPRRASVSTWLGSIARNLAIDALRVRRAVPVDPDSVEWLGMFDDRTAPDVAAERAESLAVVRAALDALPVEQRRALVRSAYFGQTATEIAAAEDIAVGTAKSRVRLGLARVRDLLASRETRDGVENRGERE